MVHKTTGDNKQLLATKKTITKDNRWQASKAMTVKSGTQKHDSNTVAMVSESKIATR